MPSRPVTINKDYLYARVLVCPETGCWQWQRAISTRGYGKFGDNRSGKSVTRLAHRLSYELHYGKIPENKWVLHTCHNRACTNPYHLYLGTAAENTSDMLRANRATRGEEHPISKLTEKDIHQIRSDSRSQHAIAYQFGVAQTHIGLIKRRKIWKHI